MRSPENTPAGSTPVRIDELAVLAGIQPDYIDNEGVVHTISTETKLKILRAMGLARGDAASIEQEVREWSVRPFRELCDATTVVRDGARNIINIYIPDEPGALERVFIKLRGETGEIVTPPAAGALVTAHAMVDGRAIARHAVPLPALAPGEWELEIYYSGESPRAGRGMIFAAPANCYLPPTVAAGGRVAGYSVQLYSLRSADDIGAGGFRAAAALGELLARETGADLLGLSPLHATPNRDPNDYSPYCPLSRVWKNSIFLDLLTLPEVANSPRAIRILAEPATRRAVESLRASERVPYAASHELQMRVLRAAFEDYYISNNPAAARSFIQFKESSGPSLRQFALFMALRDHFLSFASPIGYFRHWPPEFRDPDSPAVAAFAERHAHEIEFHCFLQFLVDREINLAQRRLRAAGMEIGFYHDLAVGSSSGSADAWAEPDIYIEGAETGAPPDIFNKTGQVWGVVPMSPLQLKYKHYEPFIRMLRSAMRGGGAVRIDHVMGLWRLWWVPRGCPATEGAYVQYPVDDLLGIIALESWRNRCMVVGEDLGTVAPGVRERMERERIPGCRLTLFERTGGDGFLNSEYYTKMSVASFSTHDLPTFAGFWLGRDIETRRRIGFYNNDTALAAARDTREREKSALAQAISGCADGANITNNDAAADAPTLSGASPVSEVLPAYHQWLARANSAIVLFSVEDALGEEHQRNLPGTTHQYPNWVARLPQVITKIGDLPFAQDWREQNGAKPQN